MYIEAAAMNFRERSAQTPSKAKPTKKNGEKEKERERKKVDGLTRIINVSYGFILVISCNCQLNNFFCVFL